MRKDLKAQEKDGGNGGTQYDGETVGFPHTVILSGTVVKSPDRLASLGNTNADGHENAVDFGNNACTGNGNVASVGRCRAVMAEHIVHDDLHQCNGDLVDAGSHTKRDNGF